MIEQLENTRQEKNKIMQVATAMEYLYTTYIRMEHSQHVDKADGT